MPDERLVSVIIPVWRDEAGLTRALGRVRDTSAVEVIVCCALGEESRYHQLRQQEAGPLWVSAPRGRACQMNAGADVARGRWLLFLHADSELPRDWLETIAEAEAHEAVVAGAFRLSLDSRDWRARVVELGVRLRVALIGLPYGDQALFVRRATFAALGGYRDLPLMEDVDLVRRVKQVGRLLHARAAVLTSARRWERDGWVRRTAQNAGLAARFMLGATPARLAQRYFNRRAAAVVMLARAPWEGGKSRLGERLDEERHADLRRALFLDTLDVVTSIGDVDHVIACEPAAAAERMRELVGSATDVIAQRGIHLGERMTHAFEDAFRLGPESVVMVGSDLPDLPARLLRDAVAVLRGHHDRVVLGPAADGGFYLIGMNRPHPELFEAIEWSTDRVLARTVDAANAAGVNVVLLDTWSDVDDVAGLERVLLASPEVTAPRTRAWGLEHSPGR